MTAQQSKQLSWLTATLLTILMAGASLWVMGVSDKATEAHQLAVQATRAQSLESIDLATVKADVRHQAGTLEEIKVSLREINAKLDRRR